MAQHSRIVLHKPHRWHLQEDGTGPTLLLLHGAGGATQSWRALFPLLAQRYRVVCLDLPGQGFSQSGAQRRFGLDEMASDVASLCDKEGIAPIAIIGHSAGTAIALRMVQLGFQTGRVIGINAALGEFKGVAGWLFPALAKLLATTPLAATVFSAASSPASIARLLKSTGSDIDDKGQSLYLRLSRDKAHVDATLSMMSQWDLVPLLNTLNTITVPVDLIVGDQDKTVPPQTSIEAAKRLGNANLVTLPGLGHLAHEEAAEDVASVIFAALETQNAEAKTPAS